MKNILLVFCIFSTTSSVLMSSRTEKYTQQFSPKTIIEGDHISRQYPKFLIEVTMSFNLDQDTIKFIEAVIEKNFNGEITDVAGLSRICDTLHKYLGGFWTGNIFESSFISANTAYRRSPSYIYFDVNGLGINLMKQRLLS